MGNIHDPDLARAIEAVKKYQNASASFLQRKLKIGYTKASELIDQMEKLGMVGPAQGEVAREVLI